MHARESGVLRVGAHGGGFVDGHANAQVSAATAEIAVHCLVDVAIGGAGVLGKQGGSRHDLSGLAVPALRNVDFEPSLL